MTRPRAERPPLWWVFADTYRTEPMHLVSPLGVDAARRALADAGLRRRRSGAWASPLRGRVADDRVVASKRMWWTNNWAPVFTGRLTEHGTGSELIGVVRTNGWARAFTPIWFAVIALLMVGAVAEGEPSAVGGLVLMCVLAIGFDHVGAWVVRTDWFEVRDGLRDALSASDVSEETAG